MQVRLDQPKYPGGAGLETVAENEEILIKCIVCRYGAGQETTGQRCSASSLQKFPGKPVKILGWMEQFMEGLLEAVGFANG